MYDQPLNQSVNEASPVNAYNRPDEAMQGSGSSAVGRSFSQLMRQPNVIGNTHEQIQHASATKSFSLGIGSNANRQKRNRTQLGQQDNLFK